MVNKIIDDNELRDVLINPKLNSRGQYICDCPFCTKTRHFYISKKTQLWDCKKCGESGNVVTLLKHLDKTYLLGEKTIQYTPQLKSIRDSVVQEEVVIEELLPRRIMPTGWKVCKHPSNVLYYLYGRNLDNLDIERYKLGYTTLMSEYNNYVLIPVYDNGEIRGFFGRYASKEVPDDIPRFKNSKGTNFAALLFGFDEIIESKTEIVILVEGIWDKIRVDNCLHLHDSESVKCVATFGKKISPEQIRKLKQKNILSVILLYDFDALKDTKKYALELENHFVTNITYTMKKDIDECSREEVLEVFSRLQTPSDFILNVIGKIG